MVLVPEFLHPLGSAQGRDERLNWIVTECKKQFDKDLKKPSESQKLEIEYFIEERCRTLRANRATRKDYTEQVLFEIGLS